ncbi:MAG: hypothetical protein IPJ81_01160 [Chitinophagaceae bacterium]|nr:hypothetical protein [Chitinophagaceae bacterium]
MKLSFKNIEPFLNSKQNKISRWFSYAGLGVGVLLLLCDLQMYININQLIKNKNTRKDGYDFISITKNITSKNMAKDNRFNMADIKEIQSQPFLDDAAPLIANQFRVKASAGNILPFSTDLFLESLNEKFIDTVPPEFTWKEGQLDVPIIFSSDFLEMYNVFAPSQDLPQLSEKSIASVPVILECYFNGGVQNFKARIIAVSDRINSILVPENFMLWANKSLANVTDVPASRVYLKTKDANNPELLSYLEQKDYRINKDKTKFGRIKQILQSVVTGLAGFGVLVILLAMILFSFYLQLMIARSKDNLQLLLTLGYSPGWLSRTVAKRWIPVYTIIITSVLVLTVFLQYCFQHFVLNNREEVSPLIDKSVWIVSAALLVLSIIINYRMVRRLLYKL